MVTESGLDVDDLTALDRFPHRQRVTLRSGDLGLDRSTSVVALAHLFEDTRRGLRLPRSEDLVARGGIEPFRIIVVSQRVARSTSFGGADTCLDIGTGIQGVGRTSFTFAQAAFVAGHQVGSAQIVVVLTGSKGPLALPDELLADLAGARLEPAVEEPVHVVPRQRDTYPGAISIRARVSDVDANRHVNYITQLAWYDEAIAAVTNGRWGGRGKSPAELMPSSYRVQYSGEVSYPGEYHIGVAVTGYDAAVVHYELVLFDGDRSLGHAEATGGRGDLPDAALSSLWSPI